MRVTHRDRRVFIRGEALPIEDAPGEASAPCLVLLTTAIYHHQSFQRKFHHAESTIAATATQ